MYLKSQNVEMARANKKMRQENGMYARLKVEFKIAKNKEMEVENG